MHVISLTFLRDFQKYDSLITKQLKKPELWFCTEWHAPTIFFLENGFLNQQRKTKLKIQSSNGIILFMHVDWLWQHFQRALSSLSRLDGWTIGTTINKLSFGVTMTTFGCKRSNKAQYMCVFRNNGLKLPSSIILRPL